MIALRHPARINMMAAFKSEFVLIVFQLPDRKSLMITLQTRLPDCFIVMTVFRRDDCLPILRSFKPANCLPKHHVLVIVKVNSDHATFRWRRAPSLLVRQADAALVSAYEEDLDHQN